MSLCLSARSGALVFKSCSIVDPQQAAPTFSDSEQFCQDRKDIYKFWNVKHLRGNWEDKRCDFLLLCRGVVGARSESSAKDCTFTTLETLNTSVNYAGSLLVAVLWLNYKFYIHSLHSYIVTHCVGERAFMKLITWTHWHHLSWPSIAKSY